MKKDAQFGGEGGGMPMEAPELNPDFDVTRAIKNEDQAAGFIASVISADPNHLPSFLGMRKEELYKNIKVNIDEIINKVPLQLQKDIQQVPMKSFEDAVGLLQYIIGVSRNAAVLRPFLFALLGLKEGALKRLHTYVPLVIKGPVELENSMEDNGKGAAPKAINFILDQYNAGKIDKEKMQAMLREYAKRKEILIREAQRNSWYKKAKKTQERRLQKMALIYSLKKNSFKKKAEPIEIDGKTTSHR